MEGFDEYRRTKMNDSWVGDDIDFEDFISEDEAEDKNNEIAQINQNLEGKDNKDNKEVNNEEEELPDNQNEEEDDTGENGCAYCGIGNGKTLIKCNDKSCQRWFCNGCADDYSASHIIFHLTKSKHKEICTSADSDFGKMVLACYNCNCKNIFLLGFLESKDKKTGLILCREPCLATCKLEDENFEKNTWVPLITEKKTFRVAYSQSRRK